MEKAHIAIIVAVVVVIVAVVGYVLYKKEKYEVPIPVAGSIPSGLSPCARQFIKKVQALPKAMLYINHKGLAALATPINQVKMINAIMNIQAAVGTTVGFSLQPSIPTSIPSEYNGVLVLILPGENEPTVLPFGKTLAFIANDMEHLYKRIPDNQVPPEIDLEMIENQGLGQ